MFAARLVTDSAGVTPATYAYSAFGSTRASTGSIANEVRFTGERTDTESGLEFLRARTYDPSTGTFLQRDTWGITPTDSQSIDAYCYTANNPVNAVDPSGHISVMYDGSRHASAPGTGQGGGGSWDTPPKTVDKAASEPQGRPDCGWNPACVINNAIGTAGDLGRDLGGGVGDAWANTGGSVIDYAISHPQQVLMLAVAAAVVAGCFSVAVAICATAAVVGAGAGFGGYTGNTVLNNVTSGGGLSLEGWDPGQALVAAGAGAGTGMACATSAGLGCFIGGAGTAGLQYSATPGSHDAGGYLLNMAGGGMLSVGGGSTLENGAGINLRAAALGTLKGSGMGSAAGWVIQQIQGWLH